MQLAINARAVRSFNANAPAIGSESFDVGTSTVTVEIYFDFYGTENARVLIDGVIEHTQWNRGWIQCETNGIDEWHLPDGFPYPKGLAQYKFRGADGDHGRGISGVAFQLWKQHWCRSTPGRRELRNGTLVFQTKSQAKAYFPYGIPGATPYWRRICQKRFVVLDTVG